MALTEEQRIARQRYIGSSDMAAILGLDSFRSAIEIWLEKRNLIERKDSGPMYRGRRLETAVLDWAEAEIGLPIARDIFKVADDGILCANLDGLLEDENEPVEAKTSATTAPDYEEWGPRGTDEIPARVIIQVQTQMYVLGPESNRARVAVLMPAFGRFDFRMYIVPRREPIIDKIRRMAEDFMNRCVRGGEMPSGLPSLDTLKRVTRMPGLEVPLADELVREWREAQAIQAAARGREKKAQEAILFALRNGEAFAEQGRCSDGSLVTYYEQSNGGPYMVKESHFRVLRVKETKKGKGNGRKQQDRGDGQDG
jgi:putative phage-type endonuclease